MRAWDNFCVIQMMAWGGGGGESENLYFKQNYTQL